MDTLLLLGLVAGGFWAFQKWKAAQPPGTQIIRPPGQEPPEQWQVLPPPKAKAGMNKYVVMLLCFLYIICPLDLVPDVFPVLGWGDDLTAAVIGLRALLKS